MLRWGGRNSVHVVLLLLTPRGGAYWAHPEEGLASFWPNRYTNAINAVNDGLRVRAAPTQSPSPLRHRTAVKGARRGVRTAVSVSLRAVRRTTAITG